MGTITGVEFRLGWEENEQKEFLKAIRQPLMVQTPLQVVIENLFQRVQGQATFMQQIKEKVDRIALKDVTADELLDRIKLLETKQADSLGEKLNPFNQQEVLARLAALEAKVLERQSSSGPDAAAGMSDLESRLSRLEAKLSGVHNVAGKLVALEQMAAGLGVGIPDLEYPTGSGPPPSAGGIGALQVAAFRPATAPQQPDGGDAAAAAPQAGTPGGGADAGEEAQVWPSAAKLMSRGNSPGHVGLTGGMAAAGAAPLASSLMGGVGSPRAVTPVSLPSRLAGMTALSMGGLAAGVPPIGGGSMGGPAQQQRVAQLGHEVAAVKGETDALRESVERLNQQVASLKAGLSSSASESLSRVQALEENVHTLQGQVSELVAARRNDTTRPAAPGGDVSFADLSLLRSQLEAVAAEAKQCGAAMTQLQEGELAALVERVEGLEEGTKKAGEPRDMDTLFHERINGLEAAMGDLKMELRGVLDTALEGVAKVEELEELEEQLEGRATVDQLRTVQHQTQALGQAVATVSDVLAGRGGDLGESLRAAAGALSSGPLAVTGTSAKGLRCMTCEQPVRPPPSGGSGGNGINRGGGGFLPRLDSVAGKEGMPGGPGMMVADLRASKEQLLAGLAGSGRGLKVGDIDDYANGGGPGGGPGGGMGRLGGSPPREASPGRAVERSRAARVAVGGKAQGERKAGTPVFL